MVAVRRAFVLSDLHLGQGNLAGQVNHVGQMNAMGHMPSGPHVSPSNGFGIQNQNLGPGYGMNTPAAAPPRGNAIVYVLIAILIMAIGVLAYLVMTK